MQQAMLAARSRYSIKVEVGMDRRAFFFRHVMSRGGCRAKIIPRPIAREGRYREVLTVKFSQNSILVTLSIHQFPWVFHEPERRTSLIEFAESRDGYIL